MTQSVDELLAERQTTHGEYADHAQVTQDLLAVMQAVPSWAGLPAPIKETLHMTAHKVGRVLTGNPFLRDHYDDVAGYARLISQRINADQTGLADEYVRPRPEPQPASRVQYAPDSRDEPTLVLTDADVGCDFETRDGRAARNLQGRASFSYPYECDVYLAGKLSYTAGGRFIHNQENNAADLVRRLSLKLAESDVGKRFRTRSGQIAQVTRYSPESERFPYKVTINEGARKILVTPTGTYWDDGTVHESDLVARID